MRQYTLDGIELALKAIEQRKDCKTASGIIRKMITTEKVRKLNSKSMIKKSQLVQHEYSQAYKDAIARIRSSNFEVGDTIKLKFPKRPWYVTLMQKVGL